jgi:hypothetical protein
MGDKLSAASLLLTIVGVIYSIWYPQLDAVLQTKVPAHKPDRARPHSQVAACLNTRAVPLMIASVVLFLVFLPDAAILITSSIKSYRSAGVAGLWQYDSVGTAFCFVVGLSAALTWHLVRTVWRLRVLRAALS